MESPSTTRYVVISPVRDEAQYLETTIRSMVQQTVRPAQWILVDDGSTDATASIISQYASAHSWITPVHRPSHGRDMPAVGENIAFVQGGNGPNRGTRAREAKEIEAFYAGCEKLVIVDWDYLVKIDGDVGFEPNYFEKCLAEFDADPKLGIGGGTICNPVDGKLKPEPTPQFHVRGATKIYRRACWEQIGGVIRGAGWDTLDEVKANMLGWSTRTFSHLKVAHYRFTGAANGAWQNSVKIGTWSYISGYHPLYMLARCARWTIERPYLVGSIGLLFGFLLGYIRGIPQADKQLVRYVRNQQMRRLSFLPTIWK